MSSVQGARQLRAAATCRPSRGTLQQNKGALGFRRRCGAPSRAACLIDAANTLLGMREGGRARTAALGRGAMLEPFGKNGICKWEERRRTGAAACSVSGGRAEALSGLSYAAKGRPA